MGSICVIFLDCPDLVVDLMKLKPGLKYRLIYPFAEITDHFYINQSNLSSNVFVLIDTKLNGIVIDERLCSMHQQSQQGLVCAKL